MPTPPEREPSFSAGLAGALGLAMELVVTTFVGLGLGWLIGQWLGNTVIFVLVGTLLGGAAGVTRLFRVWSKKVQ